MNNPNDIAIKSLHSALTEIHKIGNGFNGLSCNDFYEAERPENYDDIPNNIKCYDMWLGLTISHACIVNELKKLGEDTTKYNFTEEGKKERNNGNT